MTVQTREAIRGRANQHLQPGGGVSEKLQPFAPRPASPVSFYDRCPGSIFLAMKA